MRAVLALLAVVALGPQTRAATAPDGTLEGRVTDAISGVPVERAFLVLVPGRRTLLTGPDGGFRFAPLGAGTYSIRVHRIGYRDRAVDLSLAPGDRLVVDIALDRTPLVEEVSVTPPESKFEPGPAAPSAGISRNEIRALPGTLEDPIRTLTSLPGVSSINDLKGEIRLGGADPGDTVFRIDGVVVDDPYHFAWARGSTAALSAGAFDTIAVTTSGLGSELGDTISGVVDLTSSERGLNGRFFETSLGTINLSANAGGPTGGTEHGAGSWIAAGRYSNLALYRALYSVGSLGVPDFGDLIVRLHRPLGEGVDLVAGGLLFANRLDSSDPASHEWNRLAARSTTGWAGIDAPIGGGVDLTSRLSWSGSSQRFATSEGDDLSAIENRVRFSLGASGAGRGPLGRIGARWSVGADGSRLHGTTEGAVHTTGPLPPLDAASTRLGAYATIRLGWSPGWSAEVGARVDRDSRLGAAPVQPRALVSYAVDDAWSVRFGAGRYARYPRFEEEFLARGLRLAPAVSDEISTGGTLLLPAGYSIDLSVYARRMKDLTAETVNRFPDLPEATGLFERGRSRAIELGLRRAGGRLRPRLSVTMIDAVETRRGITYERNGDQPYVVDLGLVWLPADRWAISGRWMGASGLPYSPMVPLGGGRRILGPLNAARLPDYSRLDLRATWEGQWRSSRVRLYIEIANALDRENVRGRDLRWDAARRRYYFNDETSMPLVPGFGIEASWTARGRL